MENLLKPEKGEVLLNEEPLSSAYERLFAYVPQDNLLMQGTIKEVVTLFDNNVDMNRFNEALQLSCSDNFVNELALKEETFLNEKGSGLSLGEMERIAIARAIYSDAPILLLDECSASLDAQTEEKVMSNILSMGMLGTVMNGLAMQDALDKQGVDSVVMSAIRMEPVCEFFDRRKALKLLSAGSVVIFSAGTGNPFFTTDSCAALRAIESECDVIMKATKVDGIYPGSPERH